jgi:phosphoribosylformimino-5-aminoimidazole carboxamide ribotide isomerase
MRVVPVIDLQDGQVVHGFAGRRQEYRPIVSCLTASCDPLDVARAFRDQLGLTELYLADLDAIAGHPPALAVYSDLQSLGLTLWVDAGVRDASMIATLATAGISAIVVGLETVAGPGELGKILERLDAARVVFSLDLKEGRPLGDASRWKGPDSWSITEQAITYGVQRLIVLDLARVGVGSGTGTEDLCGRLVRAYPQLELLTGGGVRGLEDMVRLKQLGVRGALVASALHDGRIGPADLAALSNN